MRLEPPGKVFDNDSPDDNVDYTTAAWLDLACTDRLEVIESFLQSGMSSVNTADNDGRPALHFAASWGRLEVVKYLVDQGADVKATDNRGWTALHFAALGGHLDVRKYLVEEQGADVEATDNNGWTPRDWAAVKGHLDVVRAGGGHPAVVEYLKSKGG